MKTIAYIIMLLAAVTVSAQTGSQFANERVYQFEQQRIAAMNEEIQQEAATEAANAAKRAAIQRKAEAIEQTLQNFPWRAVDGVTQHVSVTWCVFDGAVLQTSPDGVRVRGEYASIYPNGAVSFQGEFFVKHFPYTLADGDSVPPYVAAVPDGVYTYTTVMNSDRSIHCLDFGIPCDEPAWAIMAETNKPVSDFAAKRAAARARVLAANEAAAAKNDPYGLLRMGERYRDGDGVAKDLAKARMYLMRATYAGSIEASNELAALPAFVVSTNSEVTAQSGR